MARQVLLTLVGAALGGVLGYFAFGWFLRYGLYALVLPGGLMGIGASVGRTRSFVLAGMVGVSALLLTLFTEWVHFPFKADASLSYFVAHLNKLQPTTWLMAAVGTAVGFWGPLDPFGHARRPVQRSNS